MAVAKSARSTCSCILGKAENIANAKQVKAKQTWTGLSQTLADVGEGRWEVLQRESLG